MGIKTLEDIDNLLRVGADKVCINTNAVKDINFVTKAVNKYGSQCIVVSIDYKTNKDNQKKILLILKNSNRYNSSKFY